MTFNAHPIRLGALLLGLALPIDAQAFANEIATWVAQDALDPPPANALLFVGSSSIRRWERLAPDFGAYDVIQRGFGGSQFSDLNNYVDDIVLPYDPAAIVVFEGTNDVAAGKSAQTVFDDYLAFVDLVHTGQNPARPPIPILFIAITPTPARWTLWPIASQVNALIEAHAANDPALFYIDTASAFLATGMPPSSSLFVPDQLHLNSTGYDLWTSIMRPFVVAALPPTKTYVPNPIHPPVGARLFYDFGPANPQDGAPTASPDANGNSWNNWFPVAGGTLILAGEHQGSLVTTSGAPSGIGLIIHGGLNCNGVLNGGLLEPDPVLLGELAIGTATQDYFFCDGVDSPGAFYLTGLDPALAYDLSFFATRNTPSTRVTRYNLMGRGLRSADLQTSGNGAGQAGALGNDDTVRRFRGVRPDPFGRIFVDLEVMQTFAYVGILELEVVRPHLRARAAAPANL